jgi:hypothetical protein
MTLAQLDAGQAHCRAAFTPCPTCAALVLCHIWDQMQGWVPAPQPVTSILGTVHTCPIATKEETL